MSIDGVHLTQKAIRSMMNTVEAVKRAQMQQTTVAVVAAVAATALSTIANLIDSVVSRSYLNLNSTMVNFHRMWMELKMVHSIPWLIHDHRTYVQRYELSMPI